MDLSAQDRDELVHFSERFDQLDAEDRVHDALLRVLQRKAVVEHPRAYLRTAIRRVWIDQYRSRMRTAETVPLDAFPADLL